MGMKEEQELDEMHWPLETGTSADPETDQRDTLESLLNFVKYYGDLINFNWTLFGYAISIEIFSIRLTIPWVGQDLTPPYLSALARS